MSLVYTTITLVNGVDAANVDYGYISGDKVRSLTVKAMVDSGAWTLVINEDTKRKLGLRVTGTEPTTLADGSTAFYELAGPVEVRWEGHRASCDALVLPDADEVLLGAIPMEAMDLVLQPRLEKLVPAHGDYTVHKAKGGVTNHI
jgi:clan AA aspartic protease